MKTSYHRQHNNKRHIYRILLSLFILSLIIAMLSGTGILTTLSQKTGSSLGAGIQDIEYATAEVFAFFTPRHSMVQENQDLRSKLRKLQVSRLQSTILQQENTELRALLGAEDAFKKTDQNTALARIISYNEIPYGTLLISSKENGALHIGDLVHFGDLAIGTIVNITNTTALVNLFTTSGNAYDVFIGDTPATFIGTSNGTGKVLLSRDILITIGTPVSLPVAGGRMLGVVKEIIRNNEDSLQTILIGTPFNITTLRFISVTP